MFKLELNFDGNNGINYTVKLVLKGEKYGNGAIHDRQEPIVLFQTGSYLISSYYVTTVLEIPFNKGLCLDGGQRKYDLNKFDISYVKAWIHTLFKGGNLEIEID